MSPTVFILQDFRTIAFARHINKIKFTYIVRTQVHKIIDTKNNLMGNNQSLFESKYLDGSSGRSYAASRAFTTCIVAIQPNRSRLP